MPTSEAIVGLSLLIAAGLTAAFYAFLYSLKRQTYLLVWTAAWALVALHHLSPVLEAWAGEVAWQVVLNQWLLAMGALLFLSAAQLYVQAEPWSWRTTVAAGVFAVWAAAVHLHWLEVSPLFGVAGVFFLVGWVFWKEGRKQESLADKLLGGAFVFWGMLQLQTALQDLAAGVVRWDLQVVSIIPQLFVAALMIMAQYEEEKRRVERNMLALSNLNLATSSFSGGEIQKMLSQTLDRVLNVARIPSGGLCLHHGDPGGPTAVVASGLSEKFCAGMQEGSVDDYLVTQVSRLGGLVVLRDLGNAATWEELDREETFRRFRELAVAEGLQNVVGISLQAKQRAFGVLLLGTPDNRRFAPAELRLLLALGHQIGTAVENSYLIQQTTRRTEELHLLNEIGRAISSTLDTDALFEKVFSEMRRLFDVENFYIAIYDRLRDEIRFELEVDKGVRRPKRVRAAGNHLTEYLIRTRQPVLIRDHFAEEARRLGVDPRQQTGCFCGVPLVLYDRAIGVMAAHSSQERMFDEGHLELMRVLAGQAGIAIENARLFGEEQRKSKHLTLLNNVSRHAITTLNPDEMLAKIAEEMEEALNYDHIGLGMLDYTTKEVVIQAATGHGGTPDGPSAAEEALGRRIGLGEGLVGQVARTGQMAVVRKLVEGSPRLVLRNSASGFALPILYADQLLGVLYVETLAPCDFSEEETLLLRTLGDLVAGALHNALMFQKAQEQAITDGLTGVKTHRFFMEALSAEWKRSTRAGRAFSLMLMDLDRFKFVNDFYGHLEGDAVLQRIGQILEQNCRRSDVVARYGGDEFVVLMPETNLEQARQLASKLRAWVAADPLLHEKNITGSFGLACFPMHGSTPQELIQVADSSMYLSKHQGGNAVSTPEPQDVDESKKWKRDVLEAYLGVMLKRLFATGPEAFEEIYRRLEQFTQSIASSGAESSTTAALPTAAIETVTSLALAIDAKDHYTQGHSQKVSSYAVLLAQALGERGLLPGPGERQEAQLEEIRLAGLLHDVGKVGIPEAILNKGGPLDADEWEIMKTHAELGSRILGPLAGLNPGENKGGHVRFSRIQEIVKYHHEFFDGSGYPEGLTGSTVPLGARMIALADAYDTITSERTYKKARTPEEAFAELERCAGTQFDPELVQVFIQAVRRLPQHLAHVPPASKAAEISGSSPTR